MQCALAWGINSFGDVDRTAAKSTLTSGTVRQSDMQLESYNLEFDREFSIAGYGDSHYCDMYIAGLNSKLPKQMKDKVLTLQQRVDMKKSDFQQTHAREPTPTEIKRIAKIEDIAQTLSTQ